MKIKKHKGRLIMTLSKDGTSVFLKSRPLRKNGINIYEFKVLYAINLDEEFKKETAQFFINDSMDITALRKYISTKYFNGKNIIIPSTMKLTVMRNFALPENTIMIVLDEDKTILLDDTAADIRYKKEIATKKTFDLFYRGIIEAGLSEYGLKLTEDYNIIMTQTRVIELGRQRIEEIVTKVFAPLNIIPAFRNKELNISQVARGDFFIFEQSTFNLEE